MEKPYNQYIDEWALDVLSLRKTHPDKEEEDTTTSATDEPTEREKEVLQGTYPVEKKE